MTQRTVDIPKNTPTKISVLTNVKRSDEANEHRLKEVAESFKEEERRGKSNYLEEMMKLLDKKTTTKKKKKKKRNSFGR